MKVYSIYVVGHQPLGFVHTEDHAQKAVATLTDMGYESSYATHELYFDDETLVAAFIQREKRDAWNSIPEWVINVLDLQEVRDAQLRE